MKVLFCVLSALLGILAVVSWTDFSKTSQKCAVDWKRAANECEDVLIQTHVQLDACKRGE